MISKVTEKNYFEDTGHMSVSKYKRFLQCEKLGVKGFGEPNEAMLIGSYVDAYVSGELKEFIVENPQIISSRGPTKGQLKVGFRQADEICNFIDNDKTIQQFLSGDKQTILTGEIGGVPFKSKLDNYSKGIAISDLKVMATITDRSGNYYDFISKWKYDLQLAVYQELVFQNTGERLPTYIVVVTKETPINSAIINVPQEVLDVALWDVESKVGRFYDIMIGKEEPIGCGICDICIEHREETPILTLGDLQGGGY